MDNLFKHPNNWFEHGEELTETSADERLAFFVESLQHPSFTTEFAADAGVADFLITLMGDFESEKRFDDLIQLQQTISTIQPEFYAKEFVYINENILKYALYTGNETLTEAAFAPFIDNPTRDIDVYLPLLRLIVLYGKGEWVQEIVLKDYPIIKAANGFIGDPHLDLAIYMWYQTSEIGYKKYKETGVFDINVWLAELEKVDMDKFEAADTQRIKQEFTTPIPDKETLLTEFKNDGAALLRSLSTHFMIANYENKGIPFIVSGTIWDLLLHFWFRDGKKKMSLHLTSDTFDKYCGGLSSFFGQYYCNAVAATSGGVYVYDFLYRIGLIDDTLYQNALIGIRYCQESINRSGYRVWHNGFPQNWAKPDSMSDKEHAVNQQAIAAAFAKVEVVEHKKMSTQDLWNKTIEAIAAKVDRELLLPSKSGPIARPKPISTTPKVGRNEPCPCGSGKKYKHCCGK
jgi:uncharacterized protein YchJ